MDWKPLMQNGEHRGLDGHTGSISISCGLRFLPSIFVSVTGSRVFRPSSARDNTRQLAQKPLGAEPELFSSERIDRPRPYAVKRIWRCRNSYRASGRLQPKVAALDRHLARLVDFTH